MTALPQKMRAMHYRGYGGPDQLALAEMPVPRPGPSQLLVRVAASSVNPIDWKLHNGGYRWIMPVRFPSVPGCDVAGEVVAVGAQVTHFARGDRIFAMLKPRRGGASAEYAVVDESAAARMPRTFSPVEAAAVPLAGLTALQAMRDLARIAPGAHVLIVGASGGVGHFAVQIAKAYGATVFAVSSGAHADMLRRLGADAVIDYTRQIDLSGPQPYDAILDLVVSAPLRTFLPLLKNTGTYVAALPTAGRIAAATLLPFCSRRRVKLIGVKARGEDLETLRLLCEAGTLRPVIDRVFRLETLAHAHAYSQRGRTAGKIAVAIGD